MVKIIAKSAAFLLSCILVFLLLEGLCSSARVVRDLVSSSRRSLAAENHTRYDRELGWGNIPNFYRKDYYNPGVYIKTNSKGFRNQEEFDVQIPANKLRVICSGDSFTFGTGVDNDHTWCQQLAALDHRLQTVNMGVPGYGVDQIYLCYLRGGAPLDHDVQFFAVVGDDFNRMQGSNVWGHGKPMLELQGDRLVATHVPVRKAPSFVRWIALRRGLWLEFKSLAALQWMLDKFRRPPPSPSLANRRIELQHRVVAKIIEALQAVNESKNSTLVLVYLPMADEDRTRDSPGTWRGLLRDEAARRGIPFIDFFADTQELPIRELERLFIPAGSQYYASAPGHLTDYGNEYVARKLYGLLRGNPEVSAKLSRLH